MITLSTDPASLAGAGQAPGDAAADSRTRIARCLERARAGETDALDEMVVELNPLLWHVARGAGLSREDAVDVVQTTWLELLRRLHEIRSPQALTSWLVTTTRRGAWRAKSRRRRESETAGEIMEALADPGLPVDEQLAAEERGRVLWRHFQRLSDRCRALLRVVVMVDRPDYEQVSAALGMPHGSIGPTRGRCLAKLREMLLADPGWSR